MFEDEDEVVLPPLLAPVDGDPPEEPCELLEPDELEELFELPLEPDFEVVVAALPPESVS